MCVLLLCLLSVAAGLRQTPLDLPQPAGAGPCTISSTTSSRKVLQTNGTADDVVHFTLCPNGVSDAVLLEDSSDQDVLRVMQGEGDVEVDRVETATACQNITAMFSFDRMVGVVNYFVKVVNELDVSDVFCETEVEFTVVGFSIFELGEEALQEFSTGGDRSAREVVLSGNENEIISDYTQTVTNTLRSFHVKVQFPDGSTSETRPVASVVQELSTVIVESDTDMTSPIHFTPSSCEVLRTLQALNRSTGTQCGAAVAVSSLESGSDISLGLLYVPYKDGLSTLVFRWPQLTSTDPDLDSDEYSNVVVVSVLGDPPPLVHHFEPRSNFRRTGKENVTLVMDNVEGSVARVLRVGDWTFPEVEGTFQKREDGLYEAVFVTERGQGAMLEWKLFVSFPEDTSRVAKISGLGFEGSSIDGFVSYSTVPIEVQEMQPPFGTEGDVVRLKGYFDGFDLEADEHDVYFGRRGLGELGVAINVNEDGTEISFQLPERRLVGAFYDYEIVVAVGNETSAVKTFSYKPDVLQLDIDVYGASYDEEEDEYQLGGCAVSRFIAVLPSGVAAPEKFEWHVSDMESEGGENLLQNYTEGEIRSMSLLLMPQVFGGKEGSFAVSVSCSLNGESLQSAVVVRKSLGPKIGVKLARLQPRSVSIPDVPVRVSAIITPPRSECYNGSSRIVYSWTYQDITEEFSYRNWSESSLNKSSTPSRLGREFLIPQSNLRPGNLTVYLKAYMEDDPSVFGRASTVFTVNHAHPVALIGYGATRVLQSVSMDLLVTGEKSYSPDEAYLGESSKVNAYHWKCRVLQTLSNMSSFTECDTQFLPDKHFASFTVPKEALLEMRNSFSTTEDMVTYYIEYSLQVGVDSWFSTWKTQIVEVSADEFEVAQLQDLQILDNRGESVDFDKLRYFEDVMVSPVGDNVVWKFSIISPKSSVFLLREPGNLILHPGYFDPSIPNLEQGFPLGVRADTFQPGQSYELLIPLSSSNPGIEPGETRIVIRTEDRPSLILPDLPIVFGDSETTFFASARVNVDSSHEFQYLFYLVRPDGEEYCLDGCGGSRDVQFRLTEAGSFMVLVRLMDMKGKSLFDELFFPQNITVSSTMFEVGARSSGTSLGEFDSMLRLIHHQGDHGTFELLASSLASRTSSGDASITSESDFKVLELAVDAMYQIVHNSAPTTMTSKSYVRTASRFAAMDSQYFSTEETMYTILSMVDKAIRNVPKTEAFDLQEELLEFYNLSAKHVISTFAASTARARVQEFDQNSGLDAGSLLIDMYLLLEDHLATVLSRDAQCGMVKQLNTIIDNGVPQGDTNNFVIDTRHMRSGARNEPDTFDILSTYQNLNKNPSHSTFTIAILCNPDQAKGLKGESTTFRWCDDVFAESNMSTDSGLTTLDPTQKRLFTILETMDFVSLSGKSDHSSQTDTRFLVGINVTLLGENGVEALGLQDIPNCFSVNTTMSRLGITSSKGCLSADGFRIQALGEPFQPKDFTQDLKRNFTSLTTNISTDGSSTVSISATRPGIFGAVGKDCPVSARKPTLAMPTEDREFAYMLLGGMAAAFVGVGVTWVGTSAAYVSTAAAAVA